MAARKKKSSSEKTLVLGIDIGGTVVKAGLVSENGDLVAHGAWATERAGFLSEANPTVSYEKFMGGLSVLVASAQRSIEDIKYIGLALPGVVVDGRLSLHPNIIIDEARLIVMLSELFTEAKIVCLNDANAAAWGEHRCGVGRDAHSLVCITLGTGVGAGVIVGDELVSGAHGATGEIGHIQVEPKGRACSCGRRGCLEQYVSARGIVRTYREAADAGIEPDVYRMLGVLEVPQEAGPVNDHDSRGVFDALQRGDGRANLAVQVLTVMLGRVLAQLALVVDPDLFIIGGGVAGSAHLFIHDLTEQYKSNSIAPVATTPVVATTLGGNAGVIGAALYALEQGESEL